MKSILSRLMRITEHFQLKSGKGLYVLGTLLVLCSLFAHLETGFKPNNNSLDRSFTLSQSYLQVSFNYSRLTPADFLKHKKSPLLASQFTAINGHSVDTEKEYCASLSGSSYGIHHRNVQQAYLLLDLPPPSSVCFI
jgi:hypothetical protein